MPEKIIIDTDPGIDDALAIFYALAIKELDIVGLTAVFGNADVEVCALNAIRLLEMAGRPDIPVAQGARMGLSTPYQKPFGLVHGDDGLGNTNLPIPKGKPVQQSAAEFIIEQVEAHPGEITLAPIGPLTNLALAIHLKPDIAKKVKRVVLMGGAAFVPGNVHPAAEANIHSDPEAADVVFRADWDIAMVGLDVTEKICITPQDVAQFEQSPKTTAQFIGKSIPHYMNFYMRNKTYPGCYMHDATVISYILHPELFEVVQHPITIGLTGSGRGKTWAWLPQHIWRQDGQTQKKVGILVNADSETVLNKLFDALL